MNQSFLSILDSLKPVGFTKNSRNFVVIGKTGDLVQSITTQLDPVLVYCVDLTVKLEKLVIFIEKEKAVHMLDSTKRRSA